MYPKLSIENSGEAGNSFFFFEFNLNSFHTSAD